MVTSVTGDLVSVGGFLTVDTAFAKITVLDSPASGSSTSIRPGDYVSGIYDDPRRTLADPPPRDPLSALYVAVRNSIHFAGLVEDVSTDHVTVLGRAIEVDRHTRFSGGNSLAELRLQRGDEVDIEGRGAGDRLVAESISVTIPWASVPGRDVIHAVVKDASPTCLDLDDSVAHETIGVFLKPETRIDVDPTPGTSVDVLLSSDKSAADEVAWFETAEGMVTSIDGDVISVAGGTLRFDQSRVIVRPEVPAAPGDFVRITYAAPAVMNRAPIPATSIVITKRAAVALTGVVEAVNAASLQVAGHAVTVGSATGFSCGIHRLADVELGSVVRISLAPRNGRLVPIDVCSGHVITPNDVSSLTLVVKDASASSWSVCDIVDHEYRVHVDAATTIVDDVKAGDAVDVIANPRTAYVERIQKSSYAISFGSNAFATRGTVKAISKTELRIGSRTARVSDDSVWYPGSPLTNVVGNPRVGDVVEVFGTNWEAVIGKAAPALPPMIVHGRVQMTPVHPMKNGRYVTCEEAAASPCAYWIATASTNYKVYTTAGSKVDIGSDGRVVATLRPTPDGYIAESILPDDAR